MIYASLQRDAQVWRQTLSQVSHHSPPAFLAHAGQGSNPRLCILTPEATLWPQHNFQLLELTWARQGRSGDSALSLWFLCQSLVCSFSLCCSSPPFCCIFPSPTHMLSSQLTRDTTQGKTAPKVLQIRVLAALCDPVPAFPALQDMQGVPLSHSCRGRRGISHLTVKQGTSAICGVFFNSAVTTTHRLCFLQGCWLLWILWIKGFSNTR